MGYSQECGFGGLEEPMKPRAEMIEGLEAWDRFKSAMKAIVSVPKSALPPNPFGKKTHKKKPTAREGKPE
jgi:hypothetical protein